MRIGVLTSLYPGPSRPYEGIFAERRWLGMQARGHRVTVTHPLPRTPGPFARGAWRELRDMPSHEDRGGIAVERPRYLHLPRRARRNARRFARVGSKRILAAAPGERPDVVVCDYAWPAAEAAPLLAAEGVPCVVSGRGSDVLLVAGEAGLGEELARCLRIAGSWCAVSADLVRAMDELGGIPGRGVLVPNGVDLATFAPAGRAAARAELGLPVEGPLVLVVGHLIERKDPVLALEVFAAGAPPDARLALLGRGPLRGPLEERARALGLDARVLLAGEVPPERLARWYAAADLLLLTSSREGRPNVVLEALACGRPVLATASGGTAELLEPWRARSLAETRDPATLGRMLRSLLGDPPPEADLRASAQPFSWDAGLDALERCLEGAVARAGGAR